MKNTSIAEALLRIGAVKVSLDNPFTWTSGIVSPVYCDNRIIISHVDIRNFIIDQMIIKLEQLGWDFEVIGGTATAAIPWAAFLAEKLNKPMVYIRSKAKAHGVGKRIEGDTVVLKGKKVLIVEDLISTGGSSISAANAAEKELETEVVGVLSIFQYGFEAMLRNFEDVKLPVASLINFENLLAEMKQQGTFKDEEITKVLEFLEDPKVWYDNL